MPICTQTHPMLKTSSAIYNNDHESIKKINPSIMSADIGVIGLAGQNLILNMNDHGCKVAAYNRTVEKVQHFLQNEAKGTNIIGCHSLDEFVNQLKPPKRILLMVKAGNPVDDFIQLLLPHLSHGSIIIDGGNSLYTDTKRRCEELEKLGIYFVGCGISGGEEGARHGPSIMPGGSPQAWPYIKEIFQSIAAKSNGRPCCEWVGPSGSGHFVKMVHNGIEYGDMQLIAETYHIAKFGLGLSNQELIDLFKSWKEKGSELESFLIDITTDILEYLDDTGIPLVEQIRDTAGQKGTGKWTVNSALDFGAPGTLFAEAVFARSLSSLKEERVKASKVLKGPSNVVFCKEISKASWLLYLKQALYASKIISYSQGFNLIQKASQEHNWDLNYSGIAQMWQGGCIIRSGLLDHIRNAFCTMSSHNNNLLLDSFFSRALETCQTGWRQVVSGAALSGIPIPALACALTYYDGYRCAKLPANLIQAQRDYFGAHTFELESNPGVFIHVNWTGKGGNVSSTYYKA